MMVKVGECSSCKSEIYKDLSNKGINSHIIVNNLKDKKTYLFCSIKCLKSWADKEIEDEI